MCMYVYIYIYTYLVQKDDDLVIRALINCNSGWENKTDLIIFFKISVIKLFTVPAAKKILYHRQPKLFG